LFGLRRQAKVSGDYVLKTCRRCKGKGAALAGSGLCTICNGAGTLLVAKPGYKCPICKGSGYSQTSNGNCEVCGGSGWSHTKYSVNA